MASKEQVTEVLKSLQLVGGNAASVEKAWSLVENLTERSKSAKHSMAALRPDQPDYPEQSNKAALLWQSLKSQLLSSLSDLDDTIKKAKTEAVEGNPWQSFKEQLKSLDQEILGDLFKISARLRDRYDLCLAIDKTQSILINWAGELGLDMPGSRAQIGGEEPLGNSPQEHLKKFMARFTRAFSYAEPSPKDKAAWFARRHI